MQVAITGLAGLFGGGDQRCGTRRVARRPRLDEFLLYDGSGQSARMDHDPAAAAAARAAAATLLDAALARGTAARLSG